MKRGLNVNASIPTATKKICSINLENQSIDNTQASTSVNRPRFEFTTSSLCRNPRFQGYPDDKFKNFFLRCINYLVCQVLINSKEYESIKDALDDVASKVSQYLHKQANISKKFIHDDTNTKKYIFHEYIDKEYIVHEEYTATFLKYIIYFVLDVFFRSNDKITKNDIQCCIGGIFNINLNKKHIFTNEVESFFYDYINTVFNLLKNNDKSLYDSLLGDHVISPLLIEKNNECCDRFDIKKPRYRIFNMSVGDKKVVSAFMNQVMYQLCYCRIVDSKKIDKCFDENFSILVSLITCGPDQIDGILKPTQNIFKAVRAFFVIRMHDVTINIGINEYTVDAPKNNIQVFIDVVFSITSMLNRIGMLKFSREELIEFSKRESEVLEKVVDPKKRDDKLMVFKKHKLISMIYTKYIFRLCLLLVDMQADEVNQAQAKIDEAIKAYAKFVSTCERNQAKIDEARKAYAKLSTGEVNQAKIDEAIKAYVKFVSRCERNQATIDEAIKSYAKFVSIVSTCQRNQATIDEDRGVYANFICNINQAQAKIDEARKAYAKFVSTCERNQAEIDEVREVYAKQDKIDKSIKAYANFVNIFKINQATINEASEVYANFANTCEINQVTINKAIDEATKFVSQCLANALQDERLFKYGRIIGKNIVPMMLQYFNDNEQRPSVQVRSRDSHNSVNIIAVSANNMIRQQLALISNEANGISGGGTYGASSSSHDNYRYGGVQQKGVSNDSGWLYGPNSANIDGQSQISNSCNTMGYYNN